MKGNVVMNARQEEDGIALAARKFAQEDEIARAVKEYIPLEQKESAIATAISFLQNEADDVVRNPFPKNWAVKKDAAKADMSVKTVQDELYEALVEDETPKDKTLAEHDKERHPGGFNPETDTCKFRDNLAKKDEADEVDIDKGVGRQEKQGEADVGKKSLVTAEEDAAYMEAVKKGDMETATEMVREAAAKAYPNTKVVGEDGKPKTVYHGTFDDFTVFDLGKSATLKGGFHLASSEDTARTAMKYYLANNYGYDLEDEDDLANVEKKIKKEGIVMHLFLNIEDLIRVDDSTANLIANGAEQRDEREGVGYVYENEVESETGEDSFMVLHASQIKSADPVTYYDDGSIVPLSKRFGGGNDIRFAVGKDEGADPSSRGERQTVDYLYNKPMTTAEIKKAEGLFENVEGFEDAAWVTPNGVKLSMGDRGYGTPDYGRPTSEHDFQGHDEIMQAFGPKHFTETELEEMDGTSDFTTSALAGGMLRLWGLKGLMEIGSSPSEKIVDTIYDYFDACKKEGLDEVTIDMSVPDAEEWHQVSRKYNVNGARRAVNEIRDFFANDGKVDDTQTVQNSNDTDKGKQRQRKAEEKSSLSPYVMSAGKPRLFAIGEPDRRGWTTGWGMDTNTVSGGSRNQLASMELKNPLNLMEGFREPQEDETIDEREETNYKVNTFCDVMEKAGVNINRKSIEANFRSLENPTIEDLIDEVGSKTFEEALKKLGYDGFVGDDDSQVTAFDRDRVVVQGDELNNGPEPKKEEAQSKSQAKVYDGLSKKQVEKYTRQMQKKHPELDADLILTEIARIKDKKLQGDAFAWVMKGAVRLPEDMYKVEQARELATKAKRDPLQWDTPQACINELTGEGHKVSERPITVDELKKNPLMSDYRDEGHGVETFQVEDSKEG